ncbi:putative SnoaL-like aldol condensation-catalyzing enzyme [Streptomyces pseudovenezuelae]|uniref:SnoaL-like aldol condensation-catalyzing enzyme n=1 Tax=Streptomyces pseudovenezuelae TaxID=67350 RepID=A0ABT6LTF1_9ACTN|nr:nuclear transport factor 2 family protein [Streptomyces pseudovenezuelae]MDH6219573.1 putative SnoaL-like aldol condensation-catalyzing enzyme [Streptomyces pseudovenezuelae]
MSNARKTVLTAAGELFGHKDPSAVDRWVAADYTQHSTLAADGPEALRRLVAGLPEGFSYEGARVIADGEPGRPARHVPRLRARPSGRLRRLPR